MSEASQPIARLGHGLTTVNFGRQTHYSAQLGALAPLIDWTSQMAGFWQSRFDHLEDLLKRMDQ